MGGAPTPMGDVRQISRVAYGFMASKALFAALDHDIFSRLSGQEKTLADLSADTGFAPNRLNTLLATLAALGLLIRRSGGYANSPAAERLFGARRAELLQRLLPTANRQADLSLLERLADGLAGRPVGSVFASL